MNLAGYFQVAVIMTDGNQTAGDDVDHKELDRLLQQAFDAASELYKRRGFQRRIGFGKRPALVSVDLANAWTRPGNPFTCDQEKMDNEIFDDYKFAVITFEHDYYCAGDYKSTREKSREMFKKRGYVSVFNDVHDREPDVVYED